jgi:hypothetical protein
MASEYISARIRIWNRKNGKSGTMKEGLNIEKETNVESDDEIYHKTSVLTITWKGKTILHSLKERIKKKSQDKTKQ